MSEEKNPDWRENDAPKIPSIYSYPNKLDELLKDVKNYEDTMHTLFYKDDNGMMKEEKHEPLFDADKAKKKVKAYNVLVKNKNTGADEWMDHTKVQADEPTGLDMRPAAANPESGANLSRPKKQMGFGVKAWNEVMSDGSTRKPAVMAPGETGHEGAFDKSLAGGSSSESSADAFKRKFPDVKMPSMAPAAPKAPMPPKAPGMMGKMQGLFGKAEQKDMTTEDVKNLQGADLERILKDTDAYEKYLGITNHDLPKLSDELVDIDEVPKNSDKSKIK